MPKKLSDSDKVADPVRSRLESASRIAALAGQAAAPAKRVEEAPEPRSPQRTTPARTPEPEPELAPAPELTHEATLGAEPSERSEVGAERFPERSVPRRAPEPVAPEPRHRVEHRTDHEALTVDRKTRFTATEAEANSDLLRLVRRLTGTKMSEAAITRVLWALLREAEAGLKQEARKGITLRRPPNGPSIEMAAYERDLGRLLLGALKSLEL